MKETYGKVNAYILNLMRHENQAMNEYNLVYKINKRFHYHLRANEVFKLHIKPLIERHWLIKTVNNMGIINYIRIGEIRHVRAEETLRDQFYSYPEDLWNYMAEYYSQDGVIREMWESDPDNLMTEKEALEYYTNLYYNK